MEVDLYLRRIKYRSFYRTCAVVFLTGTVFCLLTLRADPQQGKHLGPHLPKSLNYSSKSTLLVGVDGEVLKQGYSQRHLLALDTTTAAEEIQCIPLPQDEEELHEICQNVHLRKDDDEKCSFTLRTSYCQIINGFINYTHFVYCDLKGLVGLSMTILVIWWIFLFISLAVTADEFFCPSMVVIVKTLGLSPNVAGVTFLAFGNGAPDLFSAIVAYLIMRAGDAGMAIGGLFGAGMFVSAFIVGALAIIKPFKVTERPFLRDDIFYLIGCFWMLWIIWREKIFIGDAVGFVLLYCFYVTLVVLSGSIYKRTEGKHKNGPDDEIVMTGSSNTFSNVYGKGDLFPTSETQISLDVLDNNAGKDNPAFQHDGVGVSTDRRTSMEMILDAADADYEKLQEGAESHGGVEDGEGSGTNAPDQGDTKQGFSNGEAVSPNGNVTDQGDDEKMEDDEPPELTQADMPPFWKQFLIGINPINVAEWPEMRWYMRCFEVFKCPAVFLLKLTVPVVLYEDRPLMNWNRYLNCFQLLFSPMACAFLIAMGTLLIGDVLPVWALMLMIGVVLAVPCYFTSVDYKAPKYHEAFGYLAFLIAMVWIYVIATEIVNLLTAFGVVLQLSNGILGLTLLAWGNSVGDFVADYVMAKQGFPRMAFSACFGAPIFHLMLGTGIAFIARMGNDGVSEMFVRLDTLLFMSNLCVIASMIISLIALLSMRFIANRIYGIILIVFYFIFFILALLVETEVIPQEMR